VPVRRRASFLSLCFALSLLTPLVSAEPTSTSSAARGKVTEIHLGDSVAALNGPWKFRIGDSPTDPATGNVLWSEAGFDDSDWETVDLTPPAGSYDPIAGTSGYLPGWTARGHKGYWGYAWYRIRVRVESRPGVKLALADRKSVV